MAGAGRRKGAGLPYNDFRVVLGVKPADLLENSHHRSAKLVKNGRQYRKFG
jgi:hypothetical protein